MQGYTGDVKRLLWLVAVVASAQVSTEREDALARAFSAEVERRYPALNDEQVSQYVTGLAARIAGRPVSIKVLSDDGRLAKAVLGGHIFISAGLIARSENELSLASIIAHMVAHADDPAIPNRSMISVPLVPFCAKFSDGVGYVPFAMRETQTKWEAEVDRNGAEYLSLAADLGDGAEFEHAKQAILSRHPPRPKPTLYRKRG